MKRALLVTVAAILVATYSAPAGAGVSEGGFSSDNVEWIKNVPGTAFVASGIHGNYMYVANSRTLHVYDLRKPLAPREVGSLTYEDSVPSASGGTPATNGEILLFPIEVDAERVQREFVTDDGTNAVAIIDLSTKSRPREVGRVVLPSGRVDMVWECVLDCTWAVGAHSGTILDLRNPRRPKVLPKTLYQFIETRKPLAPLCAVGACTQDGHWIEEVRRGIVLTGTVPMYLVDLRDPRRPRALARSDGTPYSWGGVSWPEQGGSRYALSFNMGAVYSAPRCELRQANSSLEAAFATWDTRPWKTDGHATPVDTYELENGIYADGDPAAAWPPGISGCQPGWFEEHPRYKRNGIVGLTSPGHGVKFLRIGDLGQIDEVGYFLPHAGTPVFDGEWISDQIFYSIDLVRGIDVLRFTEGGR